MAIKGLTDRGQAFPQIGNIRKGDANGKNGALRDLNYFRVEFDERETMAISAFAEAYPQRPTEINILLPFNEIERCWDAWCEAYTAGRMVARSDGEYFLYLVDLKTNAVIVRDGGDENGERIPHREVIGQAGRSTIKCKPVGRLKVIIPELRRFAYVVVHTTSVIDIRNISEQLEAIKQINGGRIVGIPLVLKRRPKEISVPNPDGTKRRLTKWMLSIEADPRWVAAKLSQLDRLALPDYEGRTALPAVVEDADEDWTAEDEVEGEYEDDPEQPPVDDEWAKTASVMKAPEPPAQAEKTQAGAYVGKRSPIGKTQYPEAWAAAVAPLCKKYAALKFNMFEAEGIIKAHNVQDTATAAEVVAIIEAHLAQKAA